MKKIYWYIARLFNLFVVSIRLVLHCFTHPKDIFKLLMSIFSEINEFYQGSHGKLLKFQDTRIYEDICRDTVFAKTNVFNADAKVTRSQETQVLAALVCVFQPKSIFEIGTYNGFTTLHFAKNSADDCKIYTLDLPPDFNFADKKHQGQYSYDDELVVQLSKENISNRVFKTHPESRKIVELFGDSTTFDYSPYEGKVDMVFIDGNHSRDFVESDTKNAMKMISERGVIVWHDYDYIVHKDVFKYLNELSREINIYSISNTRFAVYGKHLE